MTQEMKKCNALSTAALGLYNIVGSWAQENAAPRVVIRMGRRLYMYEGTNNQLITTST